MKKDNHTSKLQFAKTVIVELNDDQLHGNQWWCRRFNRLAFDWMFMYLDYKNDTTDGSIKHTMKKQNSYDRLAFNKAVVAELDTQILATVNGGTSYLTVVGPTVIFTIQIMDTVPAID